MIVKMIIIVNKRTGQPSPLDAEVNETPVTAQRVAAAIRARNRSRP
jgi:hypothetical protein